MPILFNVGLELQFRNGIVDFDGLECPFYGSFLCEYTTNAKH